jgi:hypothetical protein
MPQGFLPKATQPTGLGINYLKSTDYLYMGGAVK